MNYEKNPLMFGCLAILVGVRTIGLLRNSTLLQFGHVKTRAVTVIPDNQ